MPPVASTGSRPPPARAPYIGAPVDPDVLAVLARGRCRGTVYYLPAEQLNHTLRAKVDRVLSRLGGRWNHTLHGHLFQDTLNPAPLLDLVLATGSIPLGDPTAFFPVARELAEELLLDPRLPRIPHTAQRICEPSAGQGALVDVITDHCEARGIGAVIECCELIPSFAGLLRAKSMDVVAEDFLTFWPERAYDAIVMHPPFAVDGDALAYITHITHAWNLLATGGVLLAIAPAALAFRNELRTRQLRELIEAHGTWFETDSDPFISVAGVSAVLLGMARP
ncbi:methyltransferase (plasmid) [Streptosporangium sp. NBC_01495]|uniref:methyltransferase n=1 Tax=Streptosporangium sp. NBC_01495 TaxID=2903899 RepID=UPI002E33C632|nr:methyltransferase [Streptosporangium sp. NBC_01495]